MSETNEDMAYWRAASGFDADIAEWEFRLEGAIALLESVKDASDPMEAGRAADLCSAALRDTVRQMETARDGFAGGLRAANVIGAA